MDQKTKRACIPFSESVHRFASGGRLSSDSNTCREVATSIPQGHDISRACFRIDFALKSADHVALPSSYCDSVSYVLWSGTYKFVRWPLPAHLLCLHV